MTRTEEMQGIADAIRLLDVKCIELVHEPMAIFAVVNHAKNSLNDRLATMLRGA